MVIRKTYIPLSIVVICVRVGIIIPVIPALFVGLGFLLAPTNSFRIQDLPFFWRSGLHIILTIRVVSNGNIILIGVVYPHIIAIEVNMSLSFLFKGNH
jgi:hypothetical protein